MMLYLKKLAVVWWSLKIRASFVITIYYQTDQKEAHDLIFILKNLYNHLSISFCNYLATALLKSQEEGK